MTKFTYSGTNWTGPKRSIAHDLRSLTNYGGSTVPKRTQGWTIWEPFSLISTSCQYDIRMRSISYRHLSSPARPIGARFCLLTAIQTCIQGSSEGPGKPIKRLFANF
ncbi:hypothetical protein CROQUDRAFT_99922 [Cronartium quercuum f. sp. fusiforme G11]|uniref:Uncharacterized protein n=1 Tax=Cronartium quercuum f. sp. fusiforme G11 TaxID=708437 RepID=A0A9P6N6P2_9BASI|nr:hypothetical protein CROQUDRAFT_99922 [Cronartium quercuum f. sp. fusiforme G11]